MRQVATFARTQSKRLRRYRKRSGVRDEPVHIHVTRDRQIAKFWLEPVSLAKNKGFRQHELDRIARLVVQYEVVLIEAWHDYF
ncbi:MAG: DUF4160 domain-containing protein [Bryobacterales bacterium]|nr:DUF4160 domain-containing protein [Bryobacterales bacterium]